MWKNVILTHFEMNPVTMGMSFVSCFAFYNFFFHFEFFFFFNLYPSNYICGQLYSFWSTHWLFSHNTNLGCWPQLLFSEIRAWKTWNCPASFCQLCGREIITSVCVTTQLTRQIWTPFTQRDLCLFIVSAHTTAFALGGHPSFIAI